MLNPITSAGNYGNMKYVCLDKLAKYRKSYEPARAFRDLWARVVF